MMRSTRELIRRLLADHCAQKRIERELARQQLGMDHPIVGQHEMEVERVQMALEDFLEETTS